MNDLQVSRCHDRGVKDSRVRVTRSASSQAIRRNHQRSMLKNDKELNVWQKSYEPCLKIYRMRAKFPNEERYGLTSQIRRSAVSIPSNILILRKDMEEKQPLITLAWIPMLVF